MSKSLGNTYTLATLAERGYAPLSFRYLCLTAHYRGPLNFTWTALAAADAGWRRLRGLVAALPLDGEPPGRAEAGTVRSPNLEDLRRQFWSALASDLHSPEALAVAWEAARGRDEPAARRALLAEFDRVLGLDLLGEHRLDAEDAFPSEIAALLAERQARRQQRDWAGADAIRAALQRHGYVIEDTPQGTRLKRG